MHSIYRHKRRLNMPNLKTDNVWASKPPNRAKGKVSVGLVDTGKSCTAVSNAPSPTSPQLYLIPYTLYLNSCASLLTVSSQSLALITMIIDLVKQWNGMEW